MSPNIQCIIVLQFEMHKQKPHPKNISLLLPHSIFPQLGCKKSGCFQQKLLCLVPNVSLTAARKIAVSNKALKMVTGLFQKNLCLL